MNSPIFYAIYFLPFYKLNILIFLQKVDVPIGKKSAPIQMENSVLVKIRNFQV
jgi:hypothetical protein